MKNISPIANANTIGSSPTRLDTRDPCRVALVLLQGVEGCAGYINDDVRFSFENLGLGYLAAVLRQDGHVVLISDAASTRLSNKACIQEALRFHPHLVGFSVNYSNISEVLDACHRIKKRHEAIHIVLGGPHVSFSAQDILTNEPSVDSISRGESEHTLLDLARCLRTNQAAGLESIPGLSFRRGKEVIYNKDRLAPLDLDVLPEPARDIMERRLQLGLYPSARVLTSRGCIFNCSFCLTPKLRSAQHTPLVRFRSPQRVVDEIEKLTNKFGVRLILFADDSLVLPYPAGRRHAKAIAEEIIRRKIRIRFRCFANVDSFSNHWDLFDRLCDAGMEGMFVGFESASAANLKEFRKRQNVSAAYSLIAQCSRRHVVPLPGFIMFTPHSTFQDLRVNAKFLKTTGLGYYFRTFARCFRVYPGVDMLESLREEGLLRAAQPYLGLYEYEYRTPAVGNLARILQPVRMQMVACDRIAYEMLYVSASLQMRPDSHATDENLDLVRHIRSLIDDCVLANYSFFSTCAELAERSWNQHVFCSLVKAFLADANTRKMRMQAFFDNLRDRLQRSSPGTPWDQALFSPFDGSRIGRVSILDDSSAPKHTALERCNGASH